MSAAGAVMDALNAIAVAAVVGLVAERGIRLPDDLTTDELPHLFATPSGAAPLEVVALLPHQQEGVTYTVVLVLVTVSETQEETLARVDLIRDAIRADRSLGGIVQAAFVSEVELVEHPDTPIKTAALVVTASQEVA